MVEVYKSNDLDSLRSMMTNDKDFGNIEEELLVKRNKEWVPVIIQEAKKGSAFFAFGAGHLGGKNGVINLLRSKGLTVKPVKVD